MEWGRGDLIFRVVKFDGVVGIAKGQLPSMPGATPLNIERTNFPRLLVDNGSLVAFQLFLRIPSLSRDYFLGFYHNLAFYFFGKIKFVSL